MKIDIKQLEFIDKRLREIVIYVEQSTGMEFTITSLYRIGDDGVHGQLPLRGIDLRIRSYGVGKIVEGLVNDRWIYDIDRPALNCALLHGSGKNLHLHLQSHPKTEARA